MHVEDLRITENVVEKIERKHHVSEDEVYEVLESDHNAQIA